MPPKKRTAKKDHTSSTIKNNNNNTHNSSNNNNSDTVRRGRGRPPKAAAAAAASIAIEAKNNNNNNSNKNNKKDESPLRGNHSNLAVTLSDANHAGRITTRTAVVVNTSAIRSTTRTTNSSIRGVVGKPHKRTRAEYDNNNNNNNNSDNDYKREEEIDEEITLEQLGRIALGVDGPQSPLPSTLSTTAATAATAAVAAESVRRDPQSPFAVCAAAAALASPMLTPQRENTTSPEHLTSSSGRNTSILSSVGVKGEGQRSHFSSHNIRETILYDSDDNHNHSSSHHNRDRDYNNNNNNNNGDHNDEDISNDSSIALTPVERPSTTLIRKAAATRPAVSPATLWICIDDDDDNDDEIKLISCPPSPARPVVAVENHDVLPVLTMNDTIHSVNNTISKQQQQQHQSVPPTRREPIAEVLPPTFRARKGPLQANKPPPRALSPLPNGCLIYDDDITEEDEEEEDGKIMKKQKENNYLGTRRGGILPPPPLPPLRPLSTVTSSSCLEGDIGQGSFFTLPYNTSMSYIKDDDNSTISSSVSCRSPISKEEEEEEEENNRINQLKDRVSGNKKEKSVKEKEKVNNVSMNNASQSFSLTSVVLPREDASLATFDTCVGSPTRSVRDFLFSSRRQASADWGDSSFNSFTAGATITTTAATTTIIGAGGGGGKGVLSATASVLAGNDASDVEFTRPVEKLRPLFNKKFTRKSFLNTVENVVSKLHCLEAGEFWQAFESAEYVGEGSFGIVWRCRTVDGDLVAVKSCPISFHSRASIDDAFSVLREIAIMRFLSEHEVPYVLPLHSAFFVQAREVLPPDVVAAVEWKSRLAKAEEERQQQQQQRLGKRGRKKSHLLLLDEEVKEEEKEVVVKDEEKEEVKETAEEMEERLRYEKVRLPRFLSISVEDALECDATAFLVTELCDGDLESIERHDGITKGVAFCVSSALAAMHQLGLVHLDLKPSNVLFAYENSPSQQYQIQRQQQQQQQKEHLQNHHYHSQQQQQQQNHHHHHTSTPTRESGVPSSLSLSPAGTRTTGMSMASTVKFYLSDFGNCRIVGPNPTDEVTNVFGTFEYMDIRALQDKTCSRATDCFSLGATLYELLYSRRLYPPCKNPKCVSEEDHTRHCYVEAAQQPVMILTPPPQQHHQSSCSTPPSSTPSSYSHVLQKVTAGLLALDPSERWTADRCRSFFLINGIANVATTTVTRVEAPSTSTPP
ncbi:protein kinase [Trypanosoma theileri]|uniref:Protein kinase n=1 Tax=Trypanosoma theileri TaxID=67003 RepID=A0A1X0NQU2_9TRYP|nr:protein kinase [Trypanosoma theileri]ORC86898.1 protein kinase [Trypanosoma theileri]